MDWKPNRVIVSIRSWKSGGEEKKSSEAMCTESQQKVEKLLRRFDFFLQFQASELLRMRGGVKWRLCFPPRGVLIASRFCSMRKKLFLRWMMAGWMNMEVWRELIWSWFIVGRETEQGMSWIVIKSKSNRLFMFETIKSLRFWLSLVWA